MSPKLLAIVGYVAILLNFGLCFLNQQRSSAPGLSFPRMQQCARTAQPIASLFPLEEHQVHYYFECESLTPHDRVVLNSSCLYFAKPSLLRGSLVLCCSPASLVIGIHPSYQLLLGFKLPQLPVVDNPGSWQRLPMDGVRRGVQGSRMSRST
ncbi:hypothetical protein CISG_00071 [Coccidioides immitis RMSCC 3703]|uniref:Uncharacterized protein n=2 Tax=Coccidioides immitis TaxID=5501 RepID=A0A0J8QH19_COCIT|nr:hypothetical protein CIRG_07465 [Coccidioides immitis RMSCC 2394]KMU71761.1 hypothetical protein CISG_00071 [Coccidioides immitis RMSCC 3703]